MSGIAVDPKFAQAIYVGFAPIATCHWQSLANILEIQGLDRAGDRIGLSWGARWGENESTGILYAGGRWLELANELYGVELLDRAFASREEAERFETQWLQRGIPFVAEVDAYFLPSAYEGHEHVVHTVIVLETDTSGAVVLDLMNNPDPTKYDTRRYQEMREAPCEGRTMARRLYACGGSPCDLPCDRATAKRIGRDLREAAPSDDRAFAALAQWLVETDLPVNVCRVAGERIQAARAFYAIADTIPQFRDAAGTLEALAEQWYLVHMLTTTSDLSIPRQRVRVRRLAASLYDREQRLREEVIGLAERI